MRCIAHRGFAGTNPENTLPAVRQAVEAGADCVEVDVRRCGSGELVVCHDETVDRVSDGTGAVDDLSLSSLQSLNVLGTGMGIPTLAEVFETLSEDVALNVELKERGLATDLSSLADEFDTEVLVSSFDPDALAEVGAVSGLPLAFLFAEDTGEELDTARSLDCRAVHPHHDCCDERLVETAHAAGLDVNAWTIQSKTTARRLRTLGVDGLITDHSSVCLE